MKKHIHSFLNFVCYIVIIIKLLVKLMINILLEFTLVDIEMILDFIYFQVRD